jgi:hypothetical protein
MLTTEQLATMTPDQVCAELFGRNDYTADEYAALTEHLPGINEYASIAEHNVRSGISVGSYLQTWRVDNDKTRQLPAAMATAAAKLQTKYGDPTANPLMR